MPRTTVHKPDAPSVLGLEPTVTGPSAKATLKGKSFDSQEAALRPTDATDLDAQRSARPTQVMAIHKADKAADGASRWAEAVQRYFARWDANKNGKLTPGEVNRTLARGVVTAPGTPAERVSGEELMALAALRRGSHLFKGAITLA